MPTFNPKQSYLGVDIGSSGIKIVQMGDDNGRPHLMTYGIIEQQNDIIKSDAGPSRDAVVAALKAVMKQARVTTTQAHTALPSFAVFTSILSLPLMNDKELTAAVRWEAKKFVPLPLEELVLTQSIIRKPESKAPTGNTGPKNLQVLITAAPRVLVSRYNAIFKAAGLQILSLETESWALERALIGTSTTPVMIVDIGALSTDIAVLADGIPVINRSTDVGGNTITDAIAKSLNIDSARAEQFKRDFGLTSNQQAATQIPKTIEFVISKILNELKFVLNIYRNQGTAPIEKVILTGGSAFLLNLPEFVEKSLSIKTFVGDPWSRVIYPIELKPTLMTAGPRLAVAAGLGMRGIVS